MATVKPFLRRVGKHSHVACVDAKVFGQALANQKGGLLYFFRWRRLIIVLDTKD